MMKLSVANLIQFCAFHGSLCGMVFVSFAGSCSYRLPGHVVTVPRTPAFIRDPAFMFILKIVCVLPAFIRNRRVLESKYSMCSCFVVSKLLYFKFYTF